MWLAQLSVPTYFHLRTRTPCQPLGLIRLRRSERPRHGPASADGRTRIGSAPAEETLTTIALGLSPSRALHFDPTGRAIRARWIRWRRLRSSNCTERRSFSSKFISSRRPLAGLGGVRSARDIRPSYALPARLARDASNSAMLSRMNVGSPVYNKAGGPTTQKRPIIKDGEPYYYMPVMTLMMASRGGSYRKWQLSDLGNDNRGDLRSNRLAEARRRA